MPENSSTPPSKSQSISASDASLRKNVIGQAQSNLDQKQANISSTGSAYSNIHVDQSTNTTKHEHNQTIHQVPSIDLSPIAGVLSKSYQWVIDFAKSASSSQASDPRREKMAEMNKMNRSLEAIRQELATRNLAQEKYRQLQRESLELQNKIALENLNLVKSFQTSILQEKQKTRQDEWDRYIGLSLSRDHIGNILSQYPGKFIILLPPLTNQSPLEVFDSAYEDIKAELSRNIFDHSFIAWNELSANSVNSIQAQHLGVFFSHISTLIFHSTITHTQVHIWVTLTSPDEANPNRPYQETKNLLSWNWPDYEQNLLAQGKTSEAIGRNILKVVRDIHIIVALFFGDLYCLNLKPEYQLYLPRFIESLETDPAFPDELKAWYKSFHNFLEETKRKIQESRKVSQGNIGNADFGSGSIIVGIVIGMVFLLALCSSLSKNSHPPLPNGNSTVNPRERQPESSARRGKTGIIRTPDRDSLAPLRSEPNQASPVLHELSNGTNVVLWEVSEDGQWKRVSTRGRQEGWIWSEFVQETR
jgi:hypothetical protein